MSYELEIEATTLTAIAEAMENGDNDACNYIIALHGMASRLHKMANHVEERGEDAI